MRPEGREWVVDDLRPGQLTATTCSIPLSGKRGTVDRENATPKEKGAFDASGGARDLSVAPNRVQPLHFVEGKLTGKTGEKEKQAKQRPGRQTRLLFHTRVKAGGSGGDSKKLQKRDARRACHSPPPRVAGYVLSTIIHTTTTLPFQAVLILTGCGRK